MLGVPWAPKSPQSALRCACPCWTSAQAPLRRFRPRHWPAHRRSSGVRRPCHCRRFPRPFPTQLRCPLRQPKQSLRRSQQRPLSCPHRWRCPSRRPLAPLRPLSSRRSPGSPTCCRSRMPQRSLPTRCCCPPVQVPTLDLGPLCRGTLCAPASCLRSLRDRCLSHLISLSNSRLARPLCRLLPRTDRSHPGRHRQPTGCPFSAPACPPWNQPVAGGLDR